MISIYKISSPSNKIYIGQSSNIKKRFNNYKNLHCKGQSKLYNSLKKYGWEQHKFEIIHELPEDVTQEIVNTYEDYYLQQYKECKFDVMNIREAGSRGKDNEETKRKKSISLKGKKLGIVGFGRIGQAVAKIGLGLGMEILPVDENISELNLTLDIIGTKSPVIITLKTFSLSEVLPQADVITFHVPGGCIIDSPEIAKMKKGVILINTARGGVINEEALLQGLNEGIIAQVGLDVFVNEPKPDARLLSHPKISLTPHIGAATEEAQMRIGHELAAKLLEVLTPHLSHS